MGLLIDGQWHDRWYDTGESGWPVTSCTIGGATSE